MIAKPTLLRRRSPSRPGSPRTRVKLLGLAAPGLVLLSWWGYRAARAQLLPPQAVLVLGGDLRREEFAADFAQRHPELPVWISGGSNPEFTQAVFADARIPGNQVHIDRSAVDTVTNFTTLADTLQAQQIRNVYLVTSDYHMRRSQMIGEIVFGSRGISLRPVPVPSQRPAESWVKVVRDMGRALIWVLTGYTGSTLSSEGRGKYLNR
jgi:uncharacterized SAM-binding protein YcdF (DUF218 family)